MTNRTSFGWHCILIFILVSVMFMDASALEITKKFGGPEDDYGRSIQSTLDGFILAGEKGADAWLVQTDKNGNMKWEKVIKGRRAQSVCVARDGSYVVTGAKGSDLWLAKFDRRDGRLIWERSFAAGGASTGNYVRQTADGGYIIAGTRNSMGASGDDIWLIKTDSLGNKDGPGGWDRTFGWLYNDSGLEVHQTKDGYLLAGIFVFNAEGDRCILLQKTNSTGGPGWRRLFTGAYPECCGGAEYGASLVTLQEGNRTVTLLGMTKCPGSNMECDGWLVKLYEGWKSPWEKNIGHTSEDTLSQIRATKDGKGLISAGTLDASSSFAQILVTRTNLNGDVIWSKVYPEVLDSFNTASGVDTTMEGGYAVIGSSFDHQTADQQMLLVIFRPGRPGLGPVLPSNLSANVSEEGLWEQLPAKVYPL